MAMVGNFSMRAISGERLGVPKVIYPAAKWRWAGYANKCEAALEAHTAEAKADGEELATHYKRSIAQRARRMIEVTERESKA
jgi:hypothetical protein